MKKFLSAVLALSLVAIMGGCSGANSTTTTKTAKVFKIILVAKTEGIAWFDDMRTGVQNFGDTHKDTNVKQIAPEGGDPAKQVAVMESAISEKPDAIVVVPDDPQSLVPVITKARKNGIIVIGHEASKIASTLNYDMEAMSNEDFGIAYGKKLAEAMGGKGEYLGVVGALTMQTHVEWYDAAVKYITANYPNMKLDQAQPFEDKIDTTVAYNVASQALKAYPNLGGYLAMTVESSQAMCQILKLTNNKNVKVSGLAVPSALGNYIKDGWMANGQCWRPADAGYAAINIAYMMIKDQKIETGINLGKTGYEKCTVKDGVVTANAPLFLTAANVDSLKF